MSLQHRRCEERRAQVAHLYRRGRTQTEIARELGCNPSQVSRDLGRLRATWMKAIQETTQQLRLMLVAELEEVRYEAWNAYESSCQPREISASRRREGPIPSGEASIRREPARPNPAFLGVARTCTVAKARLLGLDTRDCPPEPRIPLIETDFDREFKRLMERLFEPPRLEPQPGDRLPPGFDWPGTPQRAGLIRKAESVTNWQGGSVSDR